MLAIKNALKFTVRTQSPYHLSSRSATFVRDIYKKINYDAPFTMEDKHLILKRLNHLSSKQLEGYVSKVVAKRIMDYREKAGDFEAVEQLLDLDKIETTTLEKLCRMLMKEEASEEDLRKPEDLEKKYKFLSKDIKPSFRGYIPESSVLGLKINVTTVSYALINRYDLVEWGSIPLTPAEGGAVSQKTMEHNALFKKATEVVEQLPEADFCIQEELLNVLPRDPYMKMKYNLCKTRSYLDCVLQQSGKIGSACIHQIQPRTLDNCFQLKVGNERISIRAKFPQIREQNYEKEMPFFLNMSPQQMQEFKNFDKHSVENMAGACLQALAFRFAAKMVVKKKADKLQQIEIPDSSTTPRETIIT